MNQRSALVLSFVKDRRNQALLAFLVIAIAITSATINQISFNYKLDQDARLLEEQNILLEQQVAIKELENEFFATPYYQELRARDELGLVGAGENIIVFASPEYKQLKDEIESKYWADDTEVLEKRSERSSLEKWILFFRGKDPA